MDSDSEKELKNNFKMWPPKVYPVVDNLYRKLKNNTLAPFCSIQNFLGPNSE